ncbi:MAG TPA: BrnA antitoxin family protein [Candidatus Competibacteraceae bacterium]|nr:BrnA antitoxin family protein [Candidatus Competibacteraceae bacterium]
MKDATTGRTSKRRKTGTDWEALRRLSDADLRAGIESDPDARATDDSFWKEAQVVFPKPKQLVTLRLDADLLAWLRQENGYQTRINAILRAYMDAKKPEGVDRAKV